MSWGADIFPMTASASLTMALIYGFIWWRKRDEWANLLFTLAALGTAALAWCDLVLMHAESPAQFASAIRWAQFSFCVIILSLAGFVRLYLRAGRTWLLWTVFVLRAPSLFLNFFTGHNHNLREIISFRPSTFLGEAISIPASIVPNSSMIVGQLSSLALAIFVLDAAHTVWRRGDRRLAVTVGGTIVFFVLGAAGQLALVYWGTLATAGHTQPVLPRHHRGNGLRAGRRDVACRPTGPRAAAPVNNEWRWPQVRQTLVFGPGNSSAMKSG